MQTFKEFFDKVIDEIHHFGPNEIQPPVDFSVTKVLFGRPYHYHYRHILCLIVVLYICYLPRYIFLRFLSLFMLYRSAMYHSFFLFSDFYDDVVVEWVQHPMHDDVIILHFVVIVKCE